MHCYHHNKDLIFCSYCFSIINNYYNTRLICPICRNTMDLIIICFLCNKSYNIYYVNEICQYYSYYVNKIIKFYKNYKLKKKIKIYADLILASVAPDLFSSISYGLYDLKLLLFFIISKYDR